MGKRKSKRNRKPSAPVGFQTQGRSSLQHKYRKTILFNEKELSAINQYCEKYGIKSKSAFFRSVIISHILEQIDDNYPKLF